MEWYNFLRELCERKLTTTVRGILHLLHSVARVTVIDVGVDFVTTCINKRSKNFDKRPNRRQKNSAPQEDSGKVVDKVLSRS